LAVAVNCTPDGTTEDEWEVSQMMSFSVVADRPEMFNGGVAMRLSGKNGLLEFTPADDAFGVTFLNGRPCLAFCDDIVCTTRPYRHVSKYACILAVILFLVILRLSGARPLMHCLAL